MAAFEAAVVEHGKVAVHPDARLAFDELLQARVQRSRHAVEHHARHVAAFAEAREAGDFGGDGAGPAAAVDYEHGRRLRDARHIPGARLVADRDAVVVAHRALDDHHVASSAAVGNEAAHLLGAREEQIEVAGVRPDDLLVKHRVDVVGAALARRRRHAAPHERLQEPARERGLATAARRRSDEQPGRVAPSGGRGVISAVLRRRASPVGDFAETGAIWAWRPLPPVGTQAAAGGPMAHEHDGQVAEVAVLQLAGRRLHDALVIVGQPLAHRDLHVAQAGGHERLADVAHLGLAAREQERLRVAADGRDEVAVAAMRRHEEGVLPGRHQLRAEVDDRGDAGDGLDVEAVELPCKAGRAAVEAHVAREEHARAPDGRFAQRIGDVVAFHEGEFLTCDVRKRIEQARCADEQLAFPYRLRGSGGERVGVAQPDAHEADVHAGRLLRCRFRFRR